MYSRHVHNFITTSNPASFTNHICSELSSLGQRSLIRRERKAQIQKLGYRVWLASFPGLLFCLLFVLTIIHRSGRPHPCITVNTNGRPGNEAGVWQWGNSLIVTYYVVENNHTFIIKWARVFWRYNVKAQSAQLIDILFPLVIKYTQGTHAVVAGFLHTCKVQGKYSTN